MIFTLFLCSLTIAQNTQSPQQIRQEMARIRQTTNWDDPVAAKKANEQIKELAKKLTAANSQPGSSQGRQQQNGQTGSKDGQKMSELSQEMANQKVDIYSQIWKAAAGGKGADILLAEPIREEIVAEYEKEDKREPISFVSEELETLVIDMSVKGIQALIDVMPIYKSIKTLVIVSSDSPAPVDIRAILKNAENYPLNELYIVNFGIFVASLPQEISHFSNLTTLCISNNHFASVPSEIGSLHQLKKLYISKNPLNTTFPVINNLQNIEELGIAQTKVQESEINQIKSMYPSCKIITE